MGKRWKHFIRKSGHQDKVREEFRKIRREGKRETSVVHTDTRTQTQFGKPMGDKLEFTFNGLQTLNTKKMKLSLKGRLSNHFVDSKSKRGKKAENEEPRIKNE